HVREAFELALDEDEKLTLGQIGPGSKEGVTGLEVLDRISRLLDQVHDRPRGIAVVGRHGGIEGQRLVWVDPVEVLRRDRKLARRGFGYERALVAGQMIAAPKLIPNFSEDLRARETPERKLAG